MIRQCTISLIGGSRELFNRMKNSECVQSIVELDCVQSNEENSQPNKNKVVVQGLYTKLWDAGPHSHSCEYCGAIYWYEERTVRSQNLSNPKFSNYCLEGKVQLPLLKDPPHLLKKLLDYKVRGDAALF